MSEEPEIDPTWEGDINEAVVAEWKASTSTFERVREVLLQSTAFTAPEAIAEKARVSPPTARKHLNILHDSGIAEKNETEDGVVFKRSKQQVAMQRVAEIHTDYSKEEVIAAIQELKERRKTFREKYGVDSVEEMVISIDDADEAEWNDVSEWQSLNQDLSVASAALSLYDFDPNGGPAAAGTVNGDSSVDQPVYESDETGAFSD